MRWILFITLVFLFIQCQTDKIKYDTTLLKNVLIDIHISDAAISRFSPKDRDSIRELFQSQVFEIHQVDKLTFDSMMLEIQKDPRAFRDLYTEVKDSLDILTESNK